jgi:tetratricopeptide (TPR) repeat protein
MSKIEEIIYIVEKNNFDFFFHTNKKLKNCLLKCISKKQWFKFEKYLHFLLSKNQDNIDFLLLYGFALFCQNKFDEAMKHLNKSVYTLNQYHCHYHYIGAGLSHNKAFICKNLQMQDEVDACLKRRDFLYPVEKDLNSILNIEDDMLLEHSFDRNLCIFKNSVLSILIKKALEAYNTDKLKESLCFYEEAIQICDKQHFSYHCCLSLHFYLRGLIFEKLGMLDVARYDYSKALEQDKKNPLNKLIAF